MGDYEILHGGPRLGSVMCKSTSGTVLAIPAPDLRSIIADFPEYDNMWKVDALRREALRARLSASGHQHIRCRDLAAQIIQRQARKRWQLSVLASTGLGEPSHVAHETVPF